MTQESGSSVFMLENENSLWRMFVVVAVENVVALCVVQVNQNAIKQ